MKQFLLELKWFINKNRKGLKILNKGTVIVEERDRLHSELLVRERHGENIEKEKEYLRALNWVVNEIS